MSLAVNISAVQFWRGDLLETVAVAIRESGIAPGKLELEITETVMMEFPDIVAEKISALKRLGVRIALDDFGTGYSSLSYLNRFAVDTLKVDRSFVDGLGTEPGDTAITEAIIAMSHALSLDVVGEGAETALQIAELTRLGCDFAQGFHFSRPVPADDITRMLTAGPAWA